MTKPWGGAPPSSRKRIDDFVGRPLFIIIGGIRRNVPGQYGVQDLPHVTLVSLSGPDAGSVYTDIIVFTSRVRDKLTQCEPGEVRLVNVLDKGKAPDIEDADTWAERAATAWYDANPGLLDKLRAEAMEEFRAFVANVNRSAVAAQGGTTTSSYAPPPQEAPPQTYTPSATMQSMEVPPTPPQEQEPPF